MAVRKKKGKSEKRRKASFLILLSCVAALVFSLAVLWQVLPFHRETAPRESLSELRNRLAKERSERKRQLDGELSELQMENEKLRREIERLKAEKQ
jgi:flagellar basal body-associated protein FliL